MDFRSFLSQFWNAFHRVYNHRQVLEDIHKISCILLNNLNGLLLLGFENNTRGISVCRSVVKYLVTFTIIIVSKKEAGRLKSIVEFSAPFFSWEMV